MPLRIKGKDFTVFKEYAVGVAEVILRIVNNSLFIEITALSVNVFPYCAEVNLGDCIVAARPAGCTDDCVCAETATAATAILIDFFLFIIIPAPLT